MKRKLTRQHEDVGQTASRNRRRKLPLLGLTFTLVFNQSSFAVVRSRLHQEAPAAPGILALHAHRQISASLIQAKSVAD